MALSSLGTADALLAAQAGTDEERSALGEAEALLAGLLKDGPRPAKDLLKDAKSAIGGQAPEAMRPPGPLPAGRGAARA